MSIPFAYTWRSLWRRKITTLLTLGGITLVVFVFAAVLMLSNGLEQTLIASGSPDNVIVLRRSAQSEVVSQVDRYAAGVIRTLPGIALQGDGTPLTSSEVYVIINLLKHGTNAMGNVAVRGISPGGLTLRSQVQITTGRMFRFGTNEIIVGSSVASRFKGSGIGEELKFGDGLWKIVGSFQAQGTAFDSEIWGDVDQCTAAFGRPVYSSMILRLSDPGQFAAIKTLITRDPRLQTLEPKVETEYYREQSKLMSDLIKILGLVVTIIFSVGATIGAMITMYAAVANRTTEIGTLRALGFRRRNVLSSFLVESILLALVGGMAGILLASLTSFLRISTTNFGTFSELAFGFVLSPGIVLSSMIFALVMGILGGFLPAARAARLNIITALRSV